MTATILLGAAATLLLGVVIAGLVFVVVRRFASRLPSATQDPGAPAGSAATVTIVLFVLLAIAHLLAPDQVTQGRDIALARLVAGLPGLLVALLVLVGGILVAAAVRSLTERMLSRFSPGSAGTAGAVAYWAVVLVVAVVAAEQAGLATAMLRLVVVVGWAGAVATLALAVGLGARPFIEQLAAARHVHRIVAVGDIVEIDGIHGEVEAIGSTSLALIDKQGRRVEVPHRRLLDTVVVIRAAAGSEDTEAGDVAAPAADDGA